VRVGRAVAVHFARAQRRVGPVLPLKLPLARRGDARADRLGWLARRGTGQVFLRHVRHLDLQVDAIEQRPGDSVPVAKHLVRRAAAAAVGVAQVAARTWTRCLFAMGARHA